MNSSTVLYSGIQLSDVSTSLKKMACFPPPYLPSTGDNGCADVFACLLCILILLLMERSVCV